MRLEPLYGNEVIKRVLSGRPFHAYLIDGPVGSGRHTLANLLIRALLCTGNDVPCGVCNSCKKMDNGFHPDLISLDPSLKAEELRRVLESLWVRPNDGNRKVFFIDGAENLSPVNQNLLLKTIEEPPAFAAFVLLVNGKDKLLETVRSRCQILTMAPLTEEQTARWFSDHGKPFDDYALFCFALSAGYLGQTVTLWENREDAMQERCERLMEALKTHNAAETFSLCQAKNREELNAFRQAALIRLQTQLRTDEDKRKWLPTVVALEDLSETMQSNYNLKLRCVDLARRLLESTERKTQ